MIRVELGCLIKFRWAILKNTCQCLWSLGPGYFFYRAAQVLANVTNGEETFRNAGSGSCCSIHFLQLGILSKVRDLLIFILFIQNTVYLYTYLKYTFVSHPNFAAFIRLGQQYALDFAQSQGFQTLKVTSATRPTRQGNR